MSRLVECYKIMGREIVNEGVLIHYQNLFENVVNTMTDEEYKKFVEVLKKDNNKETN